MDLASVRDSSDQLVKSVQCYNPRPLFLHGYIVPFVSAYLTLFSVWFLYYSGNPEYTDYYFVSVGALVFIQILVYLSSLWSVHCYAFLAFTKVCFSTLSLILFTNHSSFHDGRLEMSSMQRVRKYVLPRTMAPLKWFVCFDPE